MSEIQLKRTPLKGALLRAPWGCRKHPIKLAARSCSGAQMAAPGSPDQFEISPKVIPPKPTGANFNPDPGEPGWGHLDPGQLGNVLPNGDDYEPHEVDAMMQQLWVEYVAANPNLFKMPD